MARVGRFGYHAAMLLKTLLMAVALLSASPSVVAQLRAERKAVRIFSKRILRQLDRANFFDTKSDSAQVIYYDGTVADRIGVAWNALPRYKDEGGVARRYFSHDPAMSYRRWYRQREWKIRQYAAYKHDFDSIVDAQASRHLPHDLRQRGSAAKWLPVPRPLRRVASARYQQLDTTQYHPSTDAGMFLTVHCAMVGRHYIMVELTAARAAQCYGRYANIPVTVVLRRRSLRWVDWWYTKGYERRD